MACSTTSWAGELMFGGEGGWVLAVLARGGEVGGEDDGGGGGEFAFDGLFVVDVDVGFVDDFPGVSIISIWGKRDVKLGSRRKLTLQSTPR